ncbi:MAG TPA: inositol monophosphatase family protein [Candidatus Paceibacterota bacterium]|nr:inositol monophosphatase family protein [Verrucomicrobiota bacterium]HRY47994.1 inositol monophosphatase family protein [Candidatus Paceibacterota bacterium]
MSIISPEIQIPPQARQVLVEVLVAAGRLLRQSHGAGLPARIKENQSSVVTQADLASERLILSRLKKVFPRHNYLAEESGYQRRGSDFTWIVDPLDGTSNFAAGLPWFGVMAALMNRNEVVLAGMYLPLTQVLYVGAKDGGVERNGVPVRLPRPPSLKETLWAYGIDATSNPAKGRRQAEVFRRLAARVRNVRATNSLVDFCYTLDGALGGFLNQNTKIWDIAPIQLLLVEAGGLMTDPAGAPVNLDLSSRGWRRNYAVLGTHPRLLPRVVRLVKQARD